MDGLTDYQQRRLDLADMIRAVLPVAHAYGDEQREQEIRTLLTRLAAGRFQLAVIGQFSRGKTTLMNALLGHAYLPMGALPMTSVVTTIRYGSRPRALVRSQAHGLPVEVPVPEVARFVARGSADRTRMQVASVEVEIPAELLRLGFEFVDTPGVGSAIATNTAATLAYLPQADTVVFVTGFDSALAKAEAEFLAAAADQAGKLFLVINKRDLVADAEAAEVTSYVRRWTRDNLPVEPPVFGISALQALDAAMAGDPGQLGSSGITPLRDALTQFLTAEQGQVALSNAAAAAADLVARQQRDLRAGQLTDGNSQDRDSIIANFESQLSELQDHLAAVTDRITEVADTAVVGILREHRPAWENELRETLAPAGIVSSGVAPAPDGDPAGEMLNALRLAGRQAASDWLGRRSAELREAVIAAAAEDIGALLDLARSPRDLGAAVARLPVLERGPAGWLAEEMPGLMIPVVHWAEPGPPPKRLRRRDRSSTAGGASRVDSAAISAVVADFADRAGAAFQDAAAGWARRLGDQAGQHAKAEAAQFRHYLSAPPRQEDLPVLADLTDRLAAFQESLAARVPDDSRPIRPEADTPAAPVPGVGRACDLCRQLETAQTEYLIHRQFLLATSESDQAQHAEASGFCPLHTWQYGHLASPVGISAGNARLVSALADALQDAEAGSFTASDLARHVAAISLIPACPACAVLATTEHKAAEQLATHTQPGVPVLCLRHLALVLESHPPLDTGKAMTGALAAALQRASDNMRSYALKREALRQSLITADEATAYVDALRLLAGQAALALPALPD
jgi:Dynamin family